ncbi:MAG: molybdopterin-dependent oxidoreductase, partial [Desulfobulbaceae bacterium]|nr:molybdopterin-dependent oxidoreductase [Desulfobulbaceae bacterium]
FVIGSNTTEAHPDIAIRMKKAVRNGAKLIVADPRKIPLIQYAELWLRLNPGTDVALLNSMMHVILEENLHDLAFIEERTNGFDDFRKGLKKFTPELGEKITGVPKDDIIRAARIFASAEKAGIYYTLGITQHTHGTDNVFSIADLALLTGNMGKKSAGVNPLRGQNNVQGACDMGCSPDVLPGYQKVTDQKARDKFEEMWGRPIPDKVGLTSTDMITAMIDGKLKGLYVMGENSVLSHAHMSHTMQGLKNIDFLVVQDIFLTETAKLADVVLPAASFAEKDGTFTNTERRVQRVRKAIHPPGDALDDLTIIGMLSSRMGYDHVRKSVKATGFQAVTG